MTNYISVFSTKIHKISMCTLRDTISLPHAEQLSTVLR